MMATDALDLVVAEDDYLVCEEICHASKAAGHRIAGRAANGRQAIEQTLSLRPDAVLIDIEMPDMDGIAAAHEISHRCPTPLVFITAHATHDKLEKASEAGAGAYVVKPPDPDEIERALTIAVARHGDLVRARNLSAELARRNEKLARLNERMEEALAEIDTLRGIIPICSYCGKVRNDEGCWEQVETYFRQRSLAEFSHSICPLCQKRVEKELDTESP